MPDDVKDGIGMPLGAVAKRLGVKGKTLACQRRGFDSLCSHQKRFRKLSRFFLYTLPRTPDPLLPSGCSVEYICRREPSMQNIEQAHRSHSDVEWHFTCSMRSKWRHRAGKSAPQPLRTTLALLDELHEELCQGQHLPCSMIARRTICTKNALHEVCTKIDLHEGRSPRTQHKRGTRNSGW